MNNLCVRAGAGTDEAAAAALAARLGLPLSADGEPALVPRRDGLSLEANGMCLRGDFVRFLPRLREHSLMREMLIKAARIRGADNLTAVDATAGLGEDSLLLAAAGFTVDLYERDPVIGALLEDTLRRAAADPALGRFTARMRLHLTDSIAALRSLTVRPDVILLDPMFPERQKSGLVKKKFQLLHLLEPPCTDEEALLEAAVAAGPRRIVVKRPIHGPYLAGRTPSYSIRGDAMRYDCLILRTE